MAVDIPITIALDRPILMQLLTVRPAGRVRCNLEKDERSVLTDGGDEGLPRYSER